MEMKLTASKLKSVSLVLFIVLVTAFSILIDFIGAQFSSSIFTDTAYWLNVVSVQSAVTILIFTSRSLYKEKEGNANETFLFLKDNLRNAFITLNGRNLNAAFRDHIATDNRSRKLKHYREILNAKIGAYTDKVKRCELKKGRADYRFRAKNKEPYGLRYALILRNLRAAEDKRGFWQGKFDRAEEEVEFVRVRYVKYSYSIVFNDEEEREKEEDDPYTHEGRDIGKILLTKGLSVFAFGVIATSFVVFDLTFSWGMVYKAIVKLLQIVLGIYTGAVAGQEFVRKKMCSKLTIRYNYVKQFMENQK